jgi:uncharacterized protein YaaN involved in tellurite resistance
MSDKMFHIATIHAELHNLKLILEQFQEILQSAKHSNERIIRSLEKFIQSSEQLPKEIQDTIKNLSEEK